MPYVNIDGGPGNWDKDVGYKSTDKSPGVGTPGWQGDPRIQDQSQMLQGLMGPMLAQMQAQQALGRSGINTNLSNQLGQYGLQRQSQALDMTALQEQYANEQFGWGQQQQQLGFEEQQDPQRYALQQQGFQQALEQATQAYGQGTRRETAGSAASGSFATLGHAQSMQDLLKQYQFQQSSIGREQQQAALDEASRQFGFGQRQAGLTEAEKYGGEQYQLGQRRAGLASKQLSLEEQDARNRASQALGQLDLSSVGSIGDLYQRMMSLMGGR